MRAPRRGAKVARMEARIERPGDGTAWVIGDDGEVIVGLAAAGLAGLEVFHPDHDHSERTRLTQLATELDLVMTGGSDDHGAFNDSGLGRETTPPEQYRRLLALATGARPVTGPALAGPR